MSALLELRGISKNYQALRPLRLSALSIAAGEIIALQNVDAPAAEMLVGLITGAVLPDEGDVVLFGQSTREVSDSDAWLAMLDRVGIVTDRAVLIAQFTVEQNIGLPFTLQVDPLGDEVRAQVAALAREVGLRAEDLKRAVSDAPPEVVARVRLARALALGPTLLVAEHASASLPRESVQPFAADLTRVARARQLALLAITADLPFAAALGGRSLAHVAATGELRAAGGWRSIFSRSG